MPGFDGTGPLGAGTMTGGGRGYCAGVSNPGPGRGLRRRMGWRHGRGGYGCGQMTPQEEIAMLKGEANTMNRELEEVQNRIKVLENTEAKE